MILFNSQFFIYYNKSLYVLRVMPDIVPLEHENEYITRPFFICSLLAILSNQTNPVYKTYEFIQKARINCCFIVCPVYYMCMYMHLKVYLIILSVLCAAPILKTMYIFLSKSEFGYIILS